MTTRGAGSLKGVSSVLSFLGGGRAGKGPVNDSCDLGGDEVILWGDTFAENADFFMVKSYATGVFLALGCSSGCLTSGVLGATCSTGTLSRCLRSLPTTMTGKGA